MLRRLLQSRSLPLSGIGSNETTGLSIYDWAKMYAPGSTLSFGGNAYQAFKTDGTQNGMLFTSNASVFALESIRILLFSEARFQWQQMRNGRPGDLFGTPDLAILEEPWAGHTTRDLLARAELDVFSAGNSYWVRTADGLVRLEPKNVKLLIGRVTEDQTQGIQIGDKLIGYAYLPDRKDTPGNLQQRAVIFSPDQVAHYKPYPDPKNPFLGVSWVSACLPDVTLDDSMQQFKTSTITNGASLSIVVSFDPTVSREQFDAFVDRFRREHERPENAAKTLFLGGGADVKTVGQSFQDLTLQATQGAGEVRMAACAGIPPAIVGFSEGLRGSSLNTGNYGEARRRLADGTMRPLWGTFAGAMSSLTPPPSGARLWYDDRDIAFLREDIADQATIFAEGARSTMVLIQAGFEPNAALDAVSASDLSRLRGQHTGLTSVQLQPPADSAGNVNTLNAPEVNGADNPDAKKGLPAPAANGNG